MKYTLQNSQFEITKAPTPLPVEVAEAVATFLVEKYDAKGWVSSYDAKTRLGGRIEFAPDYEPQTVEEEANSNV